MRAPPLAVKTMHGRWRAVASSNRCAMRSPTTVPIVPPRKLKSITPSAIGNPSSVAKPVTTASLKAISHDRRPASAGTDACRSSPADRRAESAAHFDEIAVDEHIDAIVARACGSDGRSGCIPIGSLRDLAIEHLAALRATRPQRGIRRGQLIGAPQAQPIGHRHQDDASVWGSPASVRGAAEQPSR